MQLNSEDKEAIFEIVAARYFTEQQWKWINLKKETEKIFRTYEELEEQYASYSYVSRDWYVENTGSKNTHMCNTWKELKNLVNFLKAYKGVFNFLINTGDRKSFCIVSDSKEVSETQALAIGEVKELGYTVILFLTSFPEDFDFQILQVRSVN
ncbi:MAG: hypothetical protein PHW56_02715 [Methanosarcinaceae archaeon]|nr:hypothetical protein [Methanosarcinaceae archaeon]